MPMAPDFRHLTVRWVAILTILTLAWGCAGVRNLMKPPEVKFHQVSTRQLSLTEGTFLFEFHVTNPNPLGIVVDQAVYRLKVNDQEVGHGTLDQHLSVAAGQSAPITVPLNLNFLNVIQSVADLAKVRSLPYELSGRLSSGPLTVPFQARGDLPLPQLPGLRLHEVRIKKLNLTGADLEIDLEIDNPNAFELAPTGLKCRLLLDGEAAVEALSSRLTPIGQDRTQRITLAAGLDYSRLGRSLHRLLSGRAIPYELTGRLMLVTAGNKETPLPIHLKGEIPLLR